jgi:hypothetical protein
LLHFPSEEIDFLRGPAESLRGFERVKSLINAAPVRRENVKVGRKKPHKLIPPQK